MNELVCKVRNKVASNPCPNKQTVICNNSDYEMRFDLDEEWSAYGVKTARFAFGDGMYTDVVFSGTVCSVPVMQDVFHFTVGLFAGNIRTTTTALFYARKSVLDPDGTPIDPVPSVYEQIMELLEHAVTEDEIQSVIDSALAQAKASGEFDGEDGVDGVGIVSAYVDGNGHLRILLTTGTTVDTGLVKGRDGTDGNDGTSVESAYIESGNLHIVLSNGRDIETGYVVGSDGISVANVKINDDSHLIVTLSDGNEIDAGYIGGGGGGLTPEQEEKLNNAASVDYVNEGLATKMEKHLLSLVNGQLKDGNTVLSFNALYSMLMNNPDFVVLVYSGHAYHPNEVTTEQIVFSSVRPVNGYINSFRVTMLKNGTVTETSGTAESTANKASAIDDSRSKYPSNKAVKEFVEGKNYVSDVQLNGTSTVTDGLANIPIAKGRLGVLYVSGAGLAMDNAGWIYINGASTTQLGNRANYYPVIGSNLDYAVKVAMCDGKGAEWTDEEKQSAQVRLGIRSIEGVTV